MNKLYASFALLLPLLGSIGCKSGRVRGGLDAGRRQLRRRTDVVCAEGTALNNGRCT